MPRVSQICVDPSQASQEFALFSGGGHFGSTQQASESGAVSASSSSDLLNVSVSCLSRQNGAKCNVESPSTSARFSSAFSETRKLPILFF